MKKVWPRGAGGRVEAEKDKANGKILANAGNGERGAFPFSPKKNKPRRGFAAYEAAKNTLLDCPLSPTEYMRLCKRAARKAGV